jgi:phenylacetate-CoA ligase
MKFATEKLNFLTPEQIKAFQEEKLRRQLRYCYNNSEYYRRKFKEVGTYPEDIKTIEDLRKLPIMMTKKDERESQEESLARYGHPFGMHVCARIEEITLTSTTSGTTGIPTFTYTFTRRDLDEVVANLWAFMFRYAGIQPGDRILFAYALGIYATSMILWGIRRMGAIPIDIDVRGGADILFKMAELTRPVSLVTTPSLAEYLISRAPKSIGKEVGELGFKSILLCGEPGAGIPEVRQKLESAYGGRVYDYWSPGGLGFGLSCNSDDYHGMHCYAPDYLLFEDDLVDPDTKEPIDVVDGAIGEAVHTSLEREACPVIRYAYGDIVQVFTTECPACGFKGKRVFFTGRADDLLIVKGSNVYPSAIKEVIASFIPKVTGEMRIILEVPPPRVVPPLRIKVEHGEGIQEHELADLEKQIKADMSHGVKVNPEIIWVAPGALEKSLRKTPLFEKTYE